MVEGYSFGQIKIDGKEYKHDVIVHKRVVKSWWRVSGHEVGLRDIEDIIEEKPQVVIFGKGSSGLMRVTKEVEEFLKESEIQIIQATTDEAVIKFNELSKTKDVLGAFHLTC
ncbi:MAG: MTH938/NDUFAF3 family protein [bacterium]